MLVPPSAWVSSNSTFVFPDNKWDNGYGCDFFFTLKGETYYIEVKSSEGKDENFRWVLQKSVVEELAQKEQAQAQGGILGTACHGCVV